MNAGLPGTGLGGVFYLLLALLMPVRELYLTVRGRSSRERWALVLRQFALACGILVALFATQAALLALLQSHRAIPLSPGHILAAPLTVAVVLLGVVVVTIRVWALSTRSRARTTSP